MAELEERQRALEADPQLRQQVVAIYDDVRARVRQMKATAGVTTSLPEVEALWSATPEMLLRLRHFGACVGGAKWSDYADIPDIAKGEFRKHLRKLREEAGDQLLVREAPLLGQFGLLRGHGLFTADTLSYYFYRRHAELLRNSGGAQVRRRPGTPPGAGGPSGDLGSEQRLGRVRVPVQDALSRCHVRRVVTS